MIFKYKPDAFRFGDTKVRRPEAKAFAQMFQKNYAGSILESHLRLLNTLCAKGYLPDRVINLILQYLTSRSVNFIRYFLRAYLSVGFSEVIRSQLSVKQFEHYFMQLSDW